MIGSLLVLLAEGIFTTVWTCRLSPHSRVTGDLKRRLTRQLSGQCSKQSPDGEDASPSGLEFPVPARRHIASICRPMPTRGSPRYVYSMPGRADPVGGLAFTLKRNHFPTLPSQGAIVRQQQHQPFLDITETTTILNSPSTSNYPPSDVV